MKNKENIKKKCLKCGCKLINHEKGQDINSKIYRCLDEYIPNTYKRKFCECVLTENEYKRFQKKN